MILRQIKARFYFLLNGIVKIRVYLVQMMVYIGKTERCRKSRKTINFLFRMIRTGRQRSFGVFKGSPELGMLIFLGITGT